jgi:hypothetical protein
MKRLFTEKNNFNDYYLYSLSIVNHDSIIARKEMTDKSLSSDGLDIIQISCAYINIGASENSVGNILNGIGDTLDFNFNLIKFLSTPCLQSDTIMKPSSEFFEYFHKSNIFCVLKILFEKICFENEKCEYKNGILYLRNSDESFNIQKSVAFYRIESNNLYSFQTIISNNDYMKQLEQKKIFRNIKIENVIIDEQRKMEVKKLILYGKRKKN